LLVQTFCNVVINAQAFYTIILRSVSSWMF